MMVSIFVYIVVFECCQCMIMGLHCLRLKEPLSEDRDKMTCSNDAIQVDDGRDGLPLSIDLLLHNPHASDPIRLVAKDSEPMYQGTWIRCVFAAERKKQPDLYNINPQQPCELRISVQECDISAWPHLPPIIGTSDEFTTHAFDTTWITWCMKCRHG